MLVLYDCNLGKQVYQAVLRSSLVLQTMMLDTVILWPDINENLFAVDSKRNGYVPVVQRKCLLWLMAASTPCDLLSEWTSSLVDSGEAKRWTTAGLLVKSIAETTRGSWR